MYSETYGRLPRAIATLRLVQMALNTAFEIQGEILDPDWSPKKNPRFPWQLGRVRVRSELHDRQGTLLAHFIELDALLRAIHTNVHGCRNEYNEAAQADPPLGDWCGIGGSNPVEVAHSYAQQLHYHLIQAMIPSGKRLTEEERSDRSALAKYRLRYLLSPAEGSLPLELLMRRLPLVADLSHLSEEAPPLAEMNRLRERLDRLAERLAARRSKKVSQARASEPAEARTERAENVLAQQSGSGKVSEPDQDQWFPAAWFDKRTNGLLTGEALRQAVHRKKIRVRKGGAQRRRSTNYYLLSDVRKEWPQYFKSETRDQA